MHGKEDKDKKWDKTTENKGNEEGHMRIGKHQIK